MDSLVHESHEPHLGAFFAVTGPLADRLRKMPGLLAPRLLEQLAGSSNSFRAPPHYAWQLIQDM